MNAKQLIAAVAVFAAAGSVFAAGDLQSFPEQENFVSTKTRAEVHAEIAQARAEGVLAHNEVSTSAPVVAAVSVKTREEVRAEAIRTAKTHKFSVDYDIGG